MLDAAMVERNALVQAAEVHRVVEPDAPARCPGRPRSSTSSTMSPRLSAKGAGSRSRVRRAIDSISASLGLRPPRRSAGVMRRD